MIPQSVYASADKLKKPESQPTYQSEAELSLVMQDGARETPL